MQSASAAQARVVVANQYIEINQRIYIQHRTRCVAEYMTLLSQHERAAKACSIEKPLRLVTVVRNYPNLRENPRTVQAWAGSAARKTNITSKYLRELVDECRGRVISSTVLTETTVEKESFHVINPNLDSAITESFMLSPMTNAEARQALAEAKQTCESATRD